MYSENEGKIRDLIPNDSMYGQVMAIIRADEDQRLAEDVRRRREGLQRAKKRGVRLGRPPAKKPRKFHSVYAMYQDQQISARAASQMLEISPPVFKRWVQEEQRKTEQRKSR